MTSATMERIENSPKAPSLSKSVVCLNLERHSFGNHRKLKQSQYEVDGGDKSMTSASRKLLDSPELLEIRKRMNRVRNFIQDQSLPFPMDGVHMIPIQKLEDVLFTVDNLIAEVMAAVESFLTPADGEELSPYRKCEEEAKRRNPKLYDPRDYPPEAEMRKLFSCYYHTVAIESPETQLMGRVNPEVLKAARQSSQKLWVDAAEMTRQMQAQIMLELVENLREKLTDGDNGKPKRLSNATVDNLMAFMRDFEHASNVTDYKELQALVSEGKRLLGGSVNSEALTEKLHNSAMLRADIKNKFAAIEKALVPMVGERKVRRGDE